jgi:DNA mismatch repair protein MSH5
MNGIDPSIIARANKLSLLATRGEDLLAVCAEITPEETEELVKAVSQSIHIAFIVNNV